jgi:hypothetical protein
MSQFPAQLDGSATFVTHCKFHTGVKELATSRRVSDVLPPNPQSANISSKY